MNSITVAVLIFASLSSASLGALVISPRLSARHRDEDTNTVIRLVANVFVVMTSLVFGLMINSSKNTFETVNASAHSYATNLILLDQLLRNYGIAGNGARVNLTQYVKEAIARPARANDSLEGKTDSAGMAMDMLSNSLGALQTSDSFHQDMAIDIRRQFQRITEQRWMIIEQSEGVIPLPLVVLLLAWLVLIFGSFGYRAPKNAIVVTSFVVASSLLAVAFYLVLDMDMPFNGLIQVTDEPMRRALAHIAS